MGPEARSGPRRGREGPAGQSEGWILPDRPNPGGELANLDRDKLLYAAGRREWRAWLAKHYRSEKEVWLVFWKKHTGKAGVAYSDAVEEALCFGWIDSTMRRLDEASYAQRFSPRRPGSAYSQANLERLRRLAAEGKVAEEVLAALGDLIRQPRA